MNSGTFCGKRFCSEYYINLNDLFIFSYLKSYFIVTFKSNIENHPPPSIRMFSTSFSSSLYINITVNGVSTIAFVDTGQYIYFYG